MKDTVKFGFTLLGMYALIVVLAFIFGSTLVADGVFVRILSFSVVMVVLLGFGLFEGGTKGEADSALGRRLAKRKEDKGVEPTPDELGRCYLPWKGFIAAFGGTSIVILFALYMFIAPFAGWPHQGWPTPVMRAMLFPYVTLFPIGDNANAITWFYLPLTLLYPTAVSVGYLLGPKRFSKFLRMMHENQEKRRRRQKNKRRTVAR